MRISVAGTGMIAEEVLKMLKKNFEHQYEVSAVYARPHEDGRSRKKAEAILAETFPEAKIYDSYRDMLVFDDADFVYIANVNTAHFEFTMEALSLSKNVILEKPACLTGEEVTLLHNKAQELELFLFEAVSPLYMPNYLRIKELIPSLGKIKSVVANYSQYSSRYDRYLRGDVAPAFNPECGGGALTDLNVYNINFVEGLFGEPKCLSYNANRGFNGVDTSGELTMQYEGFTAVCIGAKDKNGDSGALIEGENGYIKVNTPINSLASVTACINGNKETFNLNRYEHRLCHEFEAFERIWMENGYEEMLSLWPLSESVARAIEKR
ncbi:MAG: Gfo/Idh/MocA family oxidoreductase [Bacteroidales bacterium]|nr:Gfo/Idh/MocA family oxidoreductase [Bacteroidales bacterium]